MRLKGEFVIYQDSKYLKRSNPVNTRSRGRWRGSAPFVGEKNFRGF
jgi:hypothetical protein